ncbi:Cyclin-D-binding Myb-like transcription factor 1 [Terramyces sp. JEL0728]|nr:Cyclin-D-binding Myb-like transcription factor 1 [Terramyces sp. JEL0728]
MKSRSKRKEQKLETKITRELSKEIIEDSDAESPVRTLSIQLPNEGQQVNPFTKIPDYKTEPKQSIRINEINNKVVKTGKIKSDSDTREFSTVWRPKEAEIEAKQSFNKGMFSKTERNLIDEAVERYLTENEIPRSDLHFLIKRRTKVSKKIVGSGFQDRNPYSDKKYQGFISQIKDDSGVNRTVGQVYWFMSRAYSIYNTGKQKWGPEEDERLKELVAIHGRKWTEIEQDMCRVGCKERFDIINNEKSGKWTSEETDLLISEAKKIMDRDGINDPTKFHSFTELAAIMKTRTYRDCSNRWKVLGPQLEKKKRKWNANDFIDLLSRLLVQCETAQDDSEINWQNLVTTDDLWSAKYMRTKWLLLVERMKKKIDLSQIQFKDAVMYGLNNLHLLIDDPDANWYNSIENE